MAGAESAGRRALCAAAVLAGCALSGCIGEARVARAAGSAAVIAAGDRDGDGVLSRAEAAALLDAGVPAAVRATAAWRRLRDLLAARLLAERPKRDQPAR